jgi:hypothetical protein
MRERSLATAAALSLAVLAGCYNGKGTESTYATPAPGASTPASTRASAPSNAAPAATPPASAPSPFGTRRYSFAEHYGDGTINSDEPASTPNHRGALLFTVATATGRQEALTVLASYRYSYKVNVEPGDVLAFQAGKPWNLGTDTLGFVEVEAGGKRDRLFSAALPPSGADGIRWTTATQPLHKYAGKQVTITFGTDAVQGNATAAWITFADAGIYRPNRGPRTKS